MKEYFLLIRFLTLALSLLYIPVLKAPSSIIFEVILKFPYSLAIEPENPFKADLLIEYKDVPTVPEAASEDDKYINLPKFCLIIIGIIFFVILIIGLILVLIVKSISEFLLLINNESFLKDAQKIMVIFFNF